MSPPMEQALGSVSSPHYSTGRIVPQLSANEYIIDPKVVSIRDTYAVKDRNGNLLVYVKQAFTAFGVKFWFEDAGGQRLGEIHGKTLKMHPTYEIYDAQGQIVAWVKKEIMTMLGDKWWMEDASGQKTATIKGNIWESDYDIQDMSGQKIAQIHRNRAVVKTSYSVEIFNPAFDPYLILSYTISLAHHEKVEHR